MKEMENIMLGLLIRKNALVVGSCYGIMVSQLLHTAIKAYNFTSPSGGIHTAVKTVTFSRKSLFAMNPLLRTVQLIKSFLDFIDRFKKNKNSN